MDESIRQSLSLTTKIQEVTILHILPFFIVALLWGSTDVLIAQASIQKKQEFTPMDFSPINLIKFVLKKKIWIWMGINQVGSVLYAYLLGIYPAQYSLIWANCLTVFVSFILQKLIHFYRFKKSNYKFVQIEQSTNQKQNLKDLNQSKYTKKQIENLFGIFLIIFGIYLMLI